MGGWDALQVHEDKYPEFYPILPMRALILSGVKQFYIITEAYGVDPSLNPGDAFLVENYMPMNVISPFIGRHQEGWGDRFLDVTAIFKEDHNKLVKEKMDKVLPLSIRNILWTNPSKTYGDKAEIRIAQSLGLPAVITKGMVQAFVLHDMKKEFVTIGIVRRNLHDHKALTSAERKVLAEKLINILSIDLKPAVKEAK